MVYQVLTFVSYHRYPEHELTVEQNPTASSILTRSSSRKINNTEVINIDTDDEEFEDASETFNLDDYFVDNETKHKIEPLSKEKMPFGLLD